MRDSSIACWWRVLRVRLALASYRGAKLQALLATHDGRTDAAARDLALTLARRLHRAAARVPGGRCLDRAIALTALLRERGIAARLRLGVRRHANLPRAHAWVELDGRALGEDDTQLAGFEPLRAGEAVTWDA